MYLYRYYVKPKILYFGNRHAWSTILYIMRTCVFIGVKKKGNKANIFLSHSTSLNQTYHVWKLFSLLVLVNFERLSFFPWYFI